MGGHVAKGGSSRGREPGRDRIKLHLAQAIREGWGCNQLAKTAKTSPQVAMDELAIASRKLGAAVDKDLGIVATQMQRAAQEAIPRSVALCRRTLDTCERLIEKLEADIQDFPTISTKFGETPASPVLAGAAQKLAGAMASLSQSIKDLTGLRAAEDVAKAKAVQAGKNDQAADPWAVDFEVLDVTSND